MTAASQPVSQPPLTAGANAPAALAFENVTKSFGATQALRGFSLGIPQGESFALAGVNGAGKTTLLKCLLDFCDFDSGRIELFGVASRLTRARAPVAFLPERFSPPYFLTGRDFLRYALKLHGVDRNAGEIEQTLAALDLELEALAKPVRAFSKGMTQKLGLAACFLSAKPLLILDEPASGLDPKARALLKAQLKRARQLGQTIFFTSHSLADVEDLCDRMGIVHAGQLKFAGTPSQLVSRHQAESLEAAFLACIAAA